MRATCTVYVDSISVSVDQSLSLWAALAQTDHPLPGFCEHNGLRAQNCAGLCAVYCCRESRVKRSCRMPIIPGMYVQTKHPLLDDFRKNTVRILLAKHPNHCPVCPKNGSCTLQHFAFLSSEDTDEVATHALLSHYVRPKLQCGVLIGTQESRCVDCGLCTEFSSKVSGAESLIMGPTPDGQRLMCIGERLAPSVLSGNLVDLCPAGVFFEEGSSNGTQNMKISPLYSFDIHDGCGTRIQVLRKNKRVVGVQPDTTEAPYRWISDKVRFSYDALYHHRLAIPSIKTSTQSYCYSWDKTLDVVTKALEQRGLDHLGVFVGPCVDLETLWVLSHFKKRCRSMHVDCHQRQLPSTITNYSGMYTFGGDFTRLYDADMVVLVGLRPIYEAPLLHTILMHHHKVNHVPVVAMTEESFMPYGDNLGPQSWHLQQMMNNQSVYQKYLENAQRPLFICGYDAFSGRMGDVIANGVLYLAQKYTRAQGWKSFAFMPPSMSFIGCHDLGLYPQEAHSLSGLGMLQSLQKGYLKSLLLLGYDHIDSSLLSRGLCVYQGSHLSEAARSAHTLLPESMHYERASTYVNAEGKVLHAPQIVSPGEKVHHGAWILQEILHRLDPSYQKCEHQDIADAVCTFYQQSYGKDGEARVNAPIPLKPLALPTERWVTSMHNFYRSDGIASASPRLQQAAQAVDFSYGKHGVW